MFNILVKKNKRKYELFFSFDTSVVELIKTLDKTLREFLPSSKTWILNAEGLLELMEKVRDEKKEIFFNFETIKDKQDFRLLIDKLKKKKQDLIERKLESQIRQEKAKLLKLELVDTIDSFDFSNILKPDQKPYKHQLIGAKFTEFLHSALLAMNVGSGKSLTALLASEIDDKIDKVLILVPNSLKFNWVNEIEKFFYSKYHVISTKSNKYNNKYSIDEAKYIILNYDFFRSSSFSKKDVELLNLGKITRIICDEAHYLKNMQSNRTSNIIKTFSKVVSSFVLLTGTPIKNKLEDLFSLLHLIVPIEFTSKTRFLTEFCGMEYDMYNGGWQQATAPKLEEIYQKLEGIMYRVKKEDIFKNLPPLRICNIYLEMSNTEKKQYLDIENGLSKVDWNSGKLVDSDTNSPLAIITRLRQFTASLKIEHLKELIESQNVEDEKVVVFDMFKNGIEELYKTFKNNSFLFTGDIKSEDRQKGVDLFQTPNNKEIMNMFLTVQAGNAGINLTESSNLYLITQSFVPSENEQVYGRVHRITSLRPVTCYNLIIKNTIDEDVYYSINKKQKVISKAIDNIDFKDNNEKSVLGDILSKFRIKYQN